MGDRPPLRKDMMTKWEILEARRDAYLTRAAEIQSELDDLEKTNCGALDATST